jgi:hypothetical protein
MPKSNKPSSAAVGRRPGTGAYSVVKSAGPGSIWLLGRDTYDKANRRASKLIKAARVGSDRGPKS